ncbi:hypothetical protein [Micropruina sonneratiae]|uniref:hypothetical protein n=1 Tax=Micropruina sonneratiae TaxID=2986940 RepID=UPI002226D1CA|nr:hypothetical protein [Micropruina sp. KQZ13P-5]MCW3159390.1 hypothetical protein [Micropruina sp. KQZ13P-5]
MSAFLNLVVGFLLSPPKRDERGLSQSTENALLLAGAVAVAGIVVFAVTTFVTSQMGKLK